MFVRRLIVSGLAISLTTTTLLLGPPSAQATSPHRAGQPIYVTLLFSRTEILAADGCVPSGTHVARLDTDIASWLAARGIAGTGTLETGDTAARARTCTHFEGSMTASWADARALSRRGWTFVSHTATYPKNLAGLTPAQSYAETCGSAKAIDAHGLRGGHGLIAYPGLQPEPTALQTRYGAKCFAWGRRTGGGGITSASAGTTPPFWQRTRPPAGGPCNEPRAACYRIPGAGSPRYSMPSKVISGLASLRPGQWFTLQSFLEVTNASPAYAASSVRWDCRSADPRLHWSNDVERYCYHDWQTIVTALRKLPHVVFTDPLTVGIAFGRPAFYPF